jgi:SAM-dependent methyltransferase
MTTKIKNTHSLMPKKAPVEKRGELCEPFIAGREPGRLIFDLGVMLSLMDFKKLSEPVLDFGAGTGWISEFVSRSGFNTVSFDIHGDLEKLLNGRATLDLLIDDSKLSYAHGDGHHMPFDNSSFGHLLCYDTLHHMHDYDKVFEEFYRVLRPGGIGIFVEPGARHSSSAETIAFVEAQKLHDPDWIERDVILEEIDSIAKKSGFEYGICIVPVPHPLAFEKYRLSEFHDFQNNVGIKRQSYCDKLAGQNYWERTIFFVQKDNQD